MKSFRFYLLKFIKPLLVLLGKIELPKRKIKSKHYYELMDVIRIGDSLLSRADWSLTNLFIPGKFKHYAIYIGLEDGVPCVVEAVDPKVKITPLIDFMLTKDNIWLGEPLFLTEGECAGAAYYAASYDGYEYDYLFSMRGNKEFYCSEVGYFAYTQALDELPFSLRKTWGVYTVVPDDYYKAKTKFKHKYDR